MRIRKGRDEGDPGLLRWFFQFKHSGISEGDRGFFYASRVFWIALFIAAMVGLYFLYGYVEYRIDTTPEQRAENIQEEKMLNCLDPDHSMYVYEFEKYCNVDIPNDIQKLRENQ